MRWPSTMRLVVSLWGRWGTRRWTGMRLCSTKSLQHNWECWKLSPRWPGSTWVCREMSLSTALCRSASVCVCVCVCIHCVCVCVCKCVFVCICSHPLHCGAMFHACACVWFVMFGGGFYTPCNKTEGEGVYMHSLSPDAVLWVFCRCQGSSAIVEELYEIFHSRVLMQFCGYFMGIGAVQ